MERLTIDEVIEHCKRHTERMEDIYTKSKLEETPIENSDFMKQYWEHRQVAEWLEKLKDYEQAEEDGVVPKFHLGDEFWCLYIDKVVKAKIVSLQQKKDGRWNYTLSREISENYHDIAYYKECEYGKYFCSTKAEAEQALAEMKGE